jgi:uncharacterized protein YcfJ
MKYLTITAAIFAASAASADVSRVKIFDHSKTVVRSTPVTETRCNNVSVPIYETVTQQGNSGEGALLGMIIGGISGKVVGGNDKGAAAGAILGGIIGADKGSRPKTSQRIVGYTNEQRCEDVTVYQNTNIETYSHSTIRFYLDGKRYVVPFQK